MLYPSFLSIFFFPFYLYHLLYSFLQSLVHLDVGVGGEGRGKSCQKSVLAGSGVGAIITDRYAHQSIKCQYKDRKSVV